MSQNLTDRIVDSFTARGLTSSGSDNRPWSRHHPAVQFARAAVSAIEDDYDPSDAEVEAACAEFYDGEGGTDSWGFMMLLDDEAVATAKGRMRRSLIRAHQAKKSL